MIIYQVTSWATFFRGDTEIWSVFTLSSDMTIESRILFLYSTAKSQYSLSLYKNHQILIIKIIESWQGVWLKISPSGPDTGGGVHAFRPRPPTLRGFEKKNKTGHLYLFHFIVFLCTLKWQVTQKFHLFEGFPPSVQEFFVCQITCTFKRLSPRLFWFKITQCVPFLHIFERFCGFLIKKGTHCEILNLNNRRLGRLKVHVI